MIEEFSLVDIEAIHEREDATLAPYAMRSSQSRGRRHPEPNSPSRTVFQRDRDRIIHSTAFRRLEYKTQVFVNHEGDHYRTRLTHTLEVAQVARSIARALGLNEDLCEAISLSHDLGHPPFGHAGEDALDELMADHGGFNHNAHTLRVVDVLEKRYSEFEGLNLCWEIREAIIKHGDHFSETLAGDFEPGLQPPLEAQLSDLADSLAYSSHDIDDGLRAKFITFEDLRQTSLWGEAEEDVLGQLGTNLDEKTLAARTVSCLIDLQIQDLVETTLQRLKENGISSVEDVRSHQGLLAGLSPEMAARRAELKEFLYSKVYRHYRTMKMQEKAKRFIREIFTEYARDPRQLPPDYAREAGADDLHQVITDYIAGMTDRFCQDEYRRLFHPYERI
ncbi:MAG: deoxyguanosinetriphosphate triphosphohydrolase [Planctomycetota bacterium]|nr:deoxyguanosinetriphosphate triphosphohydrolase [Planctomycetota bacterium]MEE3297700.1 deoxyguanosinetriphosphate triphosphohydrolase [Planctomycetota bacterium]